MFLFVCLFYYGRNCQDSFKKVSGLIICKIYPASKNSKNKGTILSSKNSQTARRHIAIKQIEMLQRNENNG